MANKSTTQGSAETERERNRYRFGGFKYSLRGPTCWGPDDIVYKIVGSYTFPIDEDAEYSSSSSEE